MEMEIINKKALTDFRAAGMPEPQAEAVASHIPIPDWSRFVTKDNLGQLEARLIRWMVGIFLTFLGLLAAVTTIILNIYSLLN